MDIIKDLYKKIPKNIWICFVSGIVWGLITHIYMITHKLPNWDDLYNLRGFGSGAEYGRWLLEFIRPLYGKWSVPALNGVLAIILWAMAACFIYAALRLETVTSAVLLSFMVMTFPSIACTMTFMFTVTCYALGILFVCAGVYCYQKGRYGFIPAILLFVLSLGIYQSYICLAAGMLVCLFMVRLLRGSTFWSVWKECIKALVTLGITMVIYLFISNHMNDNLTTDRGIDTMGQIPLSRLPRLIARAYKRILEYFVIEPLSFTTPVAQVLNILICVAIAGLLIWLVWRRRIWKEWKSTLLIFVLALLIPLALASIYILAPETQDATMQMLHQYFFVYVVLLVLGELVMGQIQGREHTVKAWMNTGLAWIATLLIVLIGYQNYILTNEAYFRTSIAFDRANSYYNRIMVNVEAQEGYQYGDTVSILGNFYPEAYPVENNPIDDDKFVDMSGVAMENGLLTEGVRTWFLKTYLGIETEALTSEEMEDIKATAQYEAMPLYPAQGSIAKIEDVWVVKIHENEE
ncbi:MAG: glucosyltransferase domain-containing protein [Lachnospiraceae bacterium]|nr:glucosyltransferase domain-containing protein [Lachnospiraceae bacterium]